MKNNTLAIILSIVITALGIALLANSIIYKEWVLGFWGVAALVCLALLIRRIRMSTKKGMSQHHHYKKVTINADDFGASPEINMAIDYAFRQGIINSATIMVNAPYAQDAINKAIKEGYINYIGLHLCLDAGEPLTDAIKEYNLFGTKAFWQKKIHRFFMPRATRKALEQEIEAQMQKYISLGCTAMHIDSHHHLHHFPSILPSVISLAKKYDFRSMRISRNIGFGISPFSKIVKFILNSTIAHNFETSSYFGNMQNYKDSSLNKEKKLEIMVHPKVKNGKYVDWVDFGLYNNLDDYSILKDVQND